MNSGDWLAIAAVLVGLGLGLPLVRWIAAKTGASAEAARKIVHMAMGAACTAFPWIFDNPTPVWVLAALATVPLALLRWLPGLRQTFGSALHGVERLSYGEILFAPAVAGVFHLSGGDPILHVIPIAILTLADAAGALAGVRYGRRFYICGSGRKSVEGSLAFLAIAFLCCFVPLWLTARAETSAALWISLTLAVLAMMAEGISGRGFDNLVIPLGCHLLLVRMLELEAGPLAMRFVAATALLAVVCVGSRWSTLSGSALLGGALLGYGCAVLADPRFVLPPLGFFIAHLVTTRRHDLSNRFDHRLDAVISLSIPCLFWVLAVELESIPTHVGLMGISIAIAAQLAMVKCATRAWLFGSPQVATQVANSWLAAGLPGLVWLWQDAAQLVVPLVAAVTLTFPACLLALRSEAAFTETPTRMWMIRALISLAVSTCAFITP